MSNDRFFYIVNREHEPEYLQLRTDTWGHKDYAAAYHTLADMRQNITRLRDYKPAVFNHVQGAIDARGRFYPLAELFR